MRLIDADDIVFYQWIEGIEEYDFARRWQIDKIPTIDAVPVVRCKDCRHYWKNGDDNSKGAVCLASPKDDAFCSEGERK